MTKPVGWTLSRPPPLPSLAQSAIPLPSTNAPLSTTPPLSTYPPQLQARLLTALTHHHPPEVYIPHLKAFDDPQNAAWPKLIAACLTPQPCPQLSTAKTVLQPLNAADCDELVPEPMRGLRYKPPAPGYKPRVAVASPQRRTSNVSQTAAPRKPAVSEVIRLGTNMQPTLSRRKSALMKPSLPRIQRSMFLSGRKSEKARNAEEKEREEREEAERIRAEREKEKEAEEEQNGRRELLDLTEQDSDLDYTVRDAAEIEPTEGMDENMVRTQMDKEARPRHVGEIVKKMHTSTAGIRNIAAADADLPMLMLSDTGYARVQRRQEAASKRKVQAEANQEKEKRIADQKREKFNRKRKRKLRKAGKLVQEESEEEETSPVPQDEASQSDSHIDEVNCTKGESSDGRALQKQRIEGPPGHDGHPPNDRYRGYENRRPSDDRHYPPPPHDSRHPPPPNYSPQHHYPHPPPPPHYAPPSPYYAPPSPYYTYPPPPYYPHHPPPPPPSYYPPARAPPRLSRDEYDRRRRELYEQIGGMCNQLQSDDARAIDDFLDNQDNMFRQNESFRYIVLDKTRSEEVLLRIDRNTREWEVVRKPLRQR